MTALAIPLFMIAASRWLWPGFWLNAVVSVSLGSFIFLWSLPGDIKEAFVFDPMGVPLAFAVNLFSFLVFDGFCRRTRSRDANPRQILARGYGPEGKLAFWERPLPRWERMKADLDDPGSIDHRRKRAEEGNASWQLANHAKVGKGTGEGLACRVKASPWVRWRLRRAVKFLAGRGRF